MKRYIVTVIALMLAACDPSQDDKQISTNKQTNTEKALTATVDVAHVRQIITQRCATCHSAKPTDDVFKVAPSNVMFDNLEQMQRSAARIRARAVDTQTMPFMNKTQMTESERTIIGEWIKAGAPIEQVKTEF